MGDITPKTFAGVASIACGPWEHSLNAYSGLVPMSPQTMPSAVGERMAR